MDKLLKGLNYIGYYDDLGKYTIEIGEDAIVELIKRITNADKVDIIKIKETQVKKMNREIKIKLDNVLKAESEYVMRNEKNINTKLDKMNILFNLKKIIDNFDELEPIIAEYLNKKAEKERFER